MNEQLKLILIQAAGYSIPLLLGLISVAFLQRGFFWKYVKVRMSMGRLLLIKSRSMLLDKFLIGWVEEGCLCYKDPIDKKRKEPIKIPIPKEGVYIYRSIGVNWIDHDEDTNSVKSHGFDANSVDVRKYSDLMTRCLQKPAFMDLNWKIMIVILCFVGVCVLVTIYMGYKANQDIGLLKAAVTTLADKVSAQVVSSQTGA